MHRTLWSLYPSPQQVAHAACQRILATAAAAIRERGHFRLVLAGGTTPEQCYRLLAQQSANWSRWHLYFGDERCLPTDHPERNSLMVATALTDQVAIPAAQVHSIPAERGAEEAAAAYSAQLAESLPFDLVLLGMGEDGHTASLFPGQHHPPETLAVAVHNAPKPPPDRVSLNYTTLARSHEILILVTGASKREALRRWRAGEPLPITALSTGGHVTTLVDQACW